MALSTNLIDYVLQASAAATADVTTQPAEKCHTVVMLNTDAVNSVLVGIVDDTVALTTANSSQIPASGTLTLRIGGAKQRPCGDLAAGTQRLRIKNNGAGTPAVNFTLINGLDANAKP